MHSLLLQVLRGNWYIDSLFAEGAGIVIQNMLNGKLNVKGDADKFKPVIATFDSTDSSTGITTAKQIAVIGIYGALTKFDQECGPVGMDTIGQWIKQFDNDESISAIVLKFACPGGTVQGTAILGQTILGTKKPIIAFVDEMACSGGYWLASQCDSIYASTPRANIGSIGVMLSFADMQPAWEKEGVVFHTVNSTLSPDKNKDYEELRKGKYENYQKDVLDPLAEDFISLVKSSRTVTDETIFKGRVVFATEAKAIGLIDDIKTFDEVLEIASTTGNQSQAQTTASNFNPSISLTNPEIDMKKYPRIAVAASIDAFECTKEGVHVQEETLEAIEQHLEGLETQIAEIPIIKESLQKANETAQTQAARILELEQEVTAVRAAAGSTTATITADTEIEKVTGEGDALNKFCKENEDNPVACMEMFAKERPGMRIKHF